MKKETKNNLKTLMTIIITAIVTLSVTMLWLYGNNKIALDNNVSGVGNAFNSDAITAKLQLIKRKIDSSYLNDVDENQLNEYAIKGYVAGLDDSYSRYYTKEEMEEVTEDTTGNYVGIGVYITKNSDDNKTLIYGVIENSPAEKNGLQAGDIILAVDDYISEGDDFDTVAELLRGEEGSIVNVKILRNGETMEFKIERKSIELIRVKGQMLENNIAYIYISTFDGNVAKQFEDEYDKLVSQGATSLIVDLRNNGGGIVDEAVNIGDLFTDKDKKLLIELDKNEKEEVTYSKNDRKITMNTALLVNDKSASASEILAAIIKDHVDNGTLIGMKTYGKGVIQSLYQLTDGSGLKLTTNEYVTPNYEKINKVGISPDIEVEYTFNGTLDIENDTQLKRAIEVLTNKQ